MQGKNSPNAVKPSRRLASRQPYVSPNQLVLSGFETPFEQQLTTDNRWVRLNGLISWDKIVSVYDKQFPSKEGRPPINGRIIVGALIIKHMLDLTDRETIEQIRENMFMQYFLGFSSFSNEPPFDASLFVDIRNRLDMDTVNTISEIVIAHHFNNAGAMIEPAPAKKKEEENKDNDNENKGKKQEPTPTSSALEHASQNDLTHSATDVTKPTHSGTLIMDATVAPQNITFPTDLKLLNASREKTEEIIDKLYNKSIHGDQKPRTYRENARRDFLNTNKRKRKTHQQILEANKKQLNYLRRNLNHIETLLLPYNGDINNTDIKQRLKQYLPTLKKVYEQQYYLNTNKIQTVEDRIVNIHQPHVRPIVRGKEGVKTEFGSKLQVSLFKGFSIIDRLDWNNFNEGSCLKLSVERYYQRFGVYPSNVYADQIYCTRANRSYLKELNIKLMAKPLGRPRKEALSNQVRPGERNPIEGKFGQAKVAYGMNKIMAKLKATSESWISTIMMVLNLVNLTRLIPLCLKVIVNNLKEIYCIIKNLHINSLSLTANPN